MSLTTNVAYCDKNLTLTSKELIDGSKPRQHVDKEIDVTKLLTEHTSLLIQEMFQKCLSIKSLVIYNSLIFLCVKDKATAMIVVTDCIWV